MQVSATQKVYTKVQQSQANKDFWASYVAWKIKVAEAEQKRRQAELEARVKAYYASLRLRPVSSQPVQPAPVLGLLAGLLTGARILGQGIKTINQIVKAINSIPRSAYASSTNSSGDSAIGVSGNNLPISTSSSNSIKLNYQWQSTPTVMQESNDEENEFEICVERTVRLFSNDFNNLLGINTQIAPSTISPATLYFGGSYAGRINEIGPLYSAQSPMWSSIADEGVQYCGSKWNQLEGVEGNYSNSDVLVIGYSAGADSALMYAYNYMLNNEGSGRITGVAVLGGTMSGSMPFNGQISDLRYNWQEILDYLLLNGVDIYVVDDWADYGDEARNYQEPVGAIGIFEHVFADMEHWVNPNGDEIGVNNSEDVLQQTLGWFDTLNSQEE